MNDLIIKMVLAAWESHIKRTTEVFDKFTDDQLNKEIAPGKNRVIYLLGHLTAVHDALFPLLGLGERNYEHLDEPFEIKPDKAIPVLPSPGELRKAWKETNNRLSEKFKNLSLGEWLQKHTRISEEDFLKEPHRNRLNVVINRTNHLAYHLGQLVIV
jgi:hypothetical protein